MNDKTPTLDKLSALIAKLYAESNDFLEHPEDAQLWYNRGYANGMLEVLTELGHHRIVAPTLQKDDPSILSQVRWTPWGKAYHHGFEQGCRETLEVLQ